LFFFSGVGNAQVNGLDALQAETETSNTVAASTEGRSGMDYNRLLLSVYDVIQGFCTDERPEVSILSNLVF
jgi:hypothetical protein